MNVLLINGSPHPAGNTYQALKVVAETLEAEGLSTSWLQIGTQPVQPCTGCGACKKLGHCVFTEPLYAEAQRLVTQADALIVGTPVYFAGPNGALLSLLDRLLYSLRDQMSFKPASAIAVARRAGTTSALDTLNRYFSACNMPIVSSQYWNLIYGETAGQIHDDPEGLQTLRQLARNMVWLLRSIQQAALPLPATEPKLRTNFIR